MSTQLARNLTRLQAGGLYLPSLAYGYLFINTSWMGYLILGCISLIGAVLSHGTLDATVGPDREALPINKTAFYKLLQHALFKEKSPSDYPGNLWDVGMFDHRVPLRRWAWVVFVFITSLVLIVSYPYSVIELWSFVSADQLVPGLLIFIQITWILQITLRPFIPTSYLVLEERPESNLDISENTTELREFLSLENGLDEITEIGYKSRGGGTAVLGYRTEYTTTEEMREEIEDVAVGFAVTFAHSKYPCETLKATLHDDTGPFGSYEIKRDWAESFNEDQLMLVEYINRIVETVELDQKGQE
jgi:hypothetical protein